MQKKKKKKNLIKPESEGLFGWVERKLKKKNETVKTKGEKKE